MLDGAAVLNQIYEFVCTSSLSCWNRIFFCFIKYSCFHFKSMSNLSKSSGSTFHPRLQSLTKTHLGCIWPSPHTALNWPQVLFGAKCEQSWHHSSWTNINVKRDVPVQLWCPQHYPSHTHLIFRSSSLILWALIISSVTSLLGILNIGITFAVTTTVVNHFFTSEVSFSKTCLIITKNLLSTIPNKIHMVFLTMALKQKLNYAVRLRVPFVYSRNSRNRGLIKQPCLYFLKVDS